MLAPVRPMMLDEKTVYEQLRLWEAKKNRQHPAVEIIDGRKVGEAKMG